MGKIDIDDFSTTEKRIEVVRLLKNLQQPFEKPGDTILRALRALALDTACETPVSGGHQK